MSGAVGTGFGAGSGTGFDAAFGREPTGHWAAPGRVNLIGEHVDYADGLCLPFAIAQRTVVAAAAREDTVLRLRSLSEEEALDVDLDAVGPGSPAGWGGYAAGVLWALRAAGHPVRGLDLLVTDTVPLGAGLSSSAAVECATALAADDLFDLGLGGSTTGRQELAAACVRAENEVVGAATGGMDQAVALLATAGHALLLDTHDGATRQVPFDPAAAGLRVLVLDTRVRHRLADGQYGNRRAAVERAAAALGVPSLREVELPALAGLDPELARRARHVITEIARVRETVALLDAGRIGDIGPLLDASHASLAGDYEVSAPELDLACAAARAA
ncbi:MAG TPA: galactokinase family protein, partial [Pseudonocardia sp.]|nr:galactokinase family protein [Pseudonocardia sp.]